MMARTPGPIAGRLPNRSNLLSCSEKMIHWLRRGYVRVRRVPPRHRAVSLLPHITSGEGGGPRGPPPARPGPAPGALATAARRRDLPLELGARALADGSIEAVCRDVPAT